MTSRLISSLKDKGLLRENCLINGQWVNADDGKRIEVYNPVNGDVIVSVPKCGIRETAKAITAAYEAFPAWSGLTALERGKYLLEWERLLKENLESLAEILTLETGKPLAEARAEIRDNIAYLPWCAAEARRVAGQVIPPSRHGIQAFTRYAPIGVAAAITPWNFPFGMAPRKAAPALASGCSLVLKPSGRAPLSALAFCELGVRAGIPAGALNIVTGDSAAISEELCRNPLVRKLSFIGSSKIGKELAAQCAPTLKRLSMELGGNAPFLVFADCDLDKAVEMAMANKFRNAGQTCLCANRFLVERSVLETFAYALAKKASDLRLGDGLDPETEMGPLISPQACARVDALVADALTKGAKLLCGGHISEKGPEFYEPTVLLGITKDMTLWHEEIFGPVAPIMAFDTEDQAIELANDTVFGLASFVCAKDLRLIWKMFEKLRFGMLGANDASLPSAEIPFGGIKDSGMGREGGTETILEYMDTHYMLLGGLE